MTHLLHLHPRYFGSELRILVEKKLKEEVEGTCSGRFGYIIMVQEIKDHGEGVLMPGSGFAEFKIRYMALLLKPFKNEVLDGVVTSVNKVRSMFVELRNCTCRTNERRSFRTVFLWRLGLCRYLSHNWYFSRDMNAAALLMFVSMLKF
jgi:DNA-directed RNA polymerase subunit E'/Rpb7